MKKKYTPATENIIKEAEETLALKEEVVKPKPKAINKKKESVEKIEIVQNGDIDPIETKEWLESLSAVLEK